MYKYSWLSKKRGACVWSIKAEEISKIETNKHPTKSTKKLHSSWKKRNKSCFCFHTSLIQSFNIKFKVRSLKKGSHFSSAYENLFSALMSRKGAELSTEMKELIITLSESVQNKAELSRMLNIPRTTLTSVLSNYRRTGTVETLKRSGRKRSFTNRDRNALKRLVKSNRWLTLQDITANPNECKTKTFSQKTVQRVLHLKGCKRRLVKKKMVVREVNRKKRVKWCKEWRGRTVDNYWKKVIFSDESQIMLGTNNIWRKDDEKYNPHLICSRSERKISLMIWGCICYDGVGTPTAVEGNINSAKYINFDILDKNLWMTMRLFTEPTL